MTQLLSPPIDGARLWERVERLSLMSLPDIPWTRRAFTPPFSQSRVWLTEQFELAGLKVRVDAAGNLIGRREGKRNDLPPIVTGSHCDTVIGGGRFDGVIGVLAGIEVAQSLNDRCVELQHPLEVIDFLSEEPSDFGVSCIGSRGMCGALNPQMLASANTEGETLSQAICRTGGDAAKLDAPLRQKGDMSAFVELHIEQGPVLEKSGTPIGIVTNIVGIRRVAITVFGQPDHAGTTPMHIRRDALVGAARVVEEVHRQASAAGCDRYVVATVGQLSVSPNMSNAVPGVVRLTLEVRSDDSRVLEEFPERVMLNVRSCLPELRLAARMEPVSHSKPTHCSPVVMDAICDAAAVLGYPSRRMTSGAGHDAAYMSALGPMGMIFVPCLNGRSHCAEEWIDPTQLAAGARVLYETICLLDSKLAVAN